VKPIYYEI